MVPSVRAPLGASLERAGQARTSQEEQQQATPTGGRPARTEGGRTDSTRSDARPARSGERSERPVQRSAGAVSGGGKRRIVTLDRPRNEHLRPVNVTVQRMYFGDWTLDNMPPEDGQGGGNFRGNGGSNSSFRGGRPQQGGRSSERPSGRPQGQSGGRSGESRGQESRAPRQQVTVAPQTAGAPAAVSGESSEDANKRRRRRRGRRGGNGGSATD
jgi:ribonuclease R